MDGMFHFGPRAALCLAVAGLLSVVAASPCSAQSGRPDYRVGPGDEIEIEVFEDSALNGRRRVTSDGSISLPLAGSIEVAGRTAEGAAARIREVLEADYLQRATVGVVVTEHRSQPISVLGAVESPGTHYLTSRWNLFEAIAAAGGVTDDHGGRAQVVRRSSDGALSDHLEIDLAAVLGGARSDDNVVILAGDVITVPALREVTVYFLGEVATQGAITVKARNGATLLTAVAKAGGLSDRASPRITIRRTAGSAEPEEIVVNFQRILAGDQPDVSLMEGDLIVVKESFL